LFDNELRVTVDVEPLDPELGGDAQAVDEFVIFCHVAGCAEVQSNHIEEPINHRGDEHNAPPPRAPLRVKDPLKYMLQCSQATGAGDYCASVHSTTKSARVWDLITVCGT
jgi:hypothetical protein